MHLIGGEMSELEQAFEGRIRAAVFECHSLGYHPSDFEGMLANATAVQVAEKLVMGGDIQSGFKRIARMGRIDLSVESIMLEPQFAHLFRPAVIEAARWRLGQAGVR